MSSAISRIVGITCLFVLGYFALSLASSLAQLANLAEQAVTGAGQPVFWGLALVFSTLLLTPIIIYLRLPKPLIPPADDSRVAQEAYESALRMQLKKNPLLAGVALETNEQLPGALSTLGEEADRIVKGTASAVFVSTAVMQNGRLDGLLVLASQLRMLWRIASVYYQRPSPRQMLYLYSNVGTNVLIADNIQNIDFAELATPIVVSIFPSMKGGIPGLQGVSTLLVNSMANGAANAFLTLRVGLLAKAYCAALSSPAAQDLRQSTTAKALELVAAIVKEQGRRIASKSWETVRDTVAHAAGATIQGAKDVVSKTSEKTIEGARTIGKKMGSGLGSMKARLTRKDDEDRDV
jgi:hypothetical protein